MSNIKILDCTLRDGGYINNWNFGKETISGIVKNLSDSGVEIIEAGFLTDLPHTENDSLFSNSQELANVVNVKGESKIAVMIALGEKETNPLSLPPSKESGFDIVRITFHNKEDEINRAISFAEILKSKGYDVCMQPVGTTTYTDSELVSLVKKINSLNPYAFYLVDTLGTLYKDSLIHFVDIIDKNLNPSIRMGFHSHNNLQMSFSNAQLLIEYPSKREFIIDSSLYGMGRGAGNLCTELVVRFLNEKNGAKYDLIPILDSIDNFIYPISLKLPWGYNAHYYMSAIHNCHPNYSSYLMNMQTLTMKEVNLLLQNLPKEKRHLFDKKLIEELYSKFQRQNAGTKPTETGVKVNDDEVLVLAPGYSIVEYQTELQRFIKEKRPIVISINTKPENYDVDYVFVSNRKRLFALEYDKISKIIITSNLPKLTDDFICVDYESLCDSSFESADNAGMMLLRLMAQLGIKKAYLAGFDGFTPPSQEVYYTTDIANINTPEVAEAKNKDISKQIEKISEQMEIEFLTPSLYQGKSNGKQKI